MAAVRALCCLDILSDIFEYFAPDEYSFLVNTPEQVEYRKASRITLASAALVCKAFSDPALAVLWRVLDEIASLLRVLPNFTVHPQSLPHQQVRFYFIEYVSSCDVRIA